MIRSRIQTEFAQVEREPEIVGDVFPRHRQLDLVILAVALGHLQQEGCYPFPGVHAAEHQHVILNALQRVRREGPKLPCDFAVAAGKRKTALRLTIKMLDSLIASAEDRCSCPNSIMGPSANLAWMRHWRLVKVEETATAIPVRASSHWPSPCKPCE